MTTTSKIAGYNYDAITNTLTMSNSFAKKASPKTSSNRPVSIPFAKMEEYIAQCRDSKERLTAFDKVKALSKIQASPYSYVRTWFLDNYANYSEQPEFDADGFVVVKTKSEVEAEKKAKAEAEAQAQDAEAIPA